MLGSFKNLNGNHHYVLLATFFLGFDNGKRVTSRKYVLKTQILFHANCKYVSLENMIFYNEDVNLSELRICV